MPIRMSSSRIIPTDALSFLKSHVLHAQKYFILARLRFLRFRQLDEHPRASFFYNEFAVIGLWAFFY